LSVSVAVTAKVASSSTVTRVPSALDMWTSKAAPSASVSARSTVAPGAAACARRGGLGEVAAGQGRLGHTVGLVRAGPRWRRRRRRRRRGIGRRLRAGGAEEAGSEGAAEQRLHTFRTEPGVSTLFYRALRDVAVGEPLTGDGWAVIDLTRPGQAPPLPPLRPGETRTVTLWSIPSTATGVLLNVTATEPTSAGYLTVFPVGQPVPVASKLNFVARPDQGPRSSSERSRSLLSIARSGPVVADLVVVELLAREHGESSAITSPRCGSATSSSGPEAQS
jgi:hypothetical protein